MTMRVPAAPMAPGSATGPALVFDEPVSLWGGVDPASATVVDRLHPQRGASMAGAVVFMPFGRGSSSASSILVEMVRLGTAPAAFVLQGPDEMLTVGSLVAAELYGQIVPIVVVDETEFEVQTGDTVRILDSVVEIETR